MDCWQNKVAVVTGASSGIGEAVAADLVKKGMIVVALARRLDRLVQNQCALPDDLQPRYHPIKCDVSKEQEVNDTFAWIDKNLGGTDVLINNAGVVRIDMQLTTAEDTESFRQTVDTNVMGVAYCVRAAFKSMKQRNFDGHIIIVNSLFGEKVPVLAELSMNIYPATKFAVTALVETFRQEFFNAGTRIKVTGLCPGVVETEIVPIFSQLKEMGHPMLSPSDICGAIIYCLSTPPNVQVHHLLIKPMGEKV